MSENSANQIFTCKYCNTQFNRKDALTRHEKTSTKCFKMSHNKMTVLENKAKPNTFICNYCHTEFNRKDGLTRHIKTSKMCLNKSHEKIAMSDNEAKPRTFSCIHCHSEFSREDVLMRHIKTGKNCLKSRRKRKLPPTENQSLLPVAIKKTKIVLNRCEVCDADVKDLKTHNESKSHTDKIKETFDETVETVITAFESRIATYKVNAIESYLTPEDFLSDLQTKIINMLKIKLLEFRNLKVNFQLYGNFKNPSLETNTTELKSFNTKNHLISFANLQDLKGIYEIFLCEIKTRADEFEEQGSGWTIVNVSHVMVNINKYAPFKSGRSTEVQKIVNTKRQVKESKAAGSSTEGQFTINTQDQVEEAPESMDDQHEDDEKEGSYIALPKRIQNKHACVNVMNKDEASFAWAVVSALYPVDKHRESRGKYPHYKNVLKLDKITFPISWKDIQRFEILNDVSINIYEIINETVSSPIYYTQQKREKHVNLLAVENENTLHFCWIRNLSALIGAQTARKNLKKWFCDGCFLHFCKKEKLLEHCEKDCSKVKTILPSENRNKLKFTEFRYKIRVPFVVYADFEAILQPINLQKPKTKSKKSQSYTQQYHEHEPYSFGYYIKCGFDDTKSKYVTYRGESCAENFIKSLEEELHVYAALFKKKIPLHKTQATTKIFKNAKICYICEKKLNRKDRVQDHCHFTGEFRGAAHSFCNLNYKFTPFIPVIFHNLSKYDAHFIIKQLRNFKVEILAINKENYISFSIYSKKLELKLRFIDSFRFLSSSLNDLASHLKKPEQFRTLRKMYPTSNIDLLMRKGVFPYEYIDCLDKLNETKLPPKNCFYSSLQKCDIEDEDYTHAQKVWDYFKIKTLGEYSDLYLKSDVLLLVDVFENFRDTCLRAYKLDPAHFYTAPGLSWMAMLKHTEVELELLTDISMVKFIMNGIRGGLSQCSKKFATANNEYLDDFDDKQQSNYILYYDANNQYGWAMSQLLPLKDFRWLSETEIENFKIEQYSRDGPKGFFLEVDLKYPSALNDLHNDLPLCAEHIVPETSKSNVKKLIATLYDKHNYVLHYVNLQQALDLGLELKKIHRIMEFTQSKWLQPYIDLNTKMRIASTNTFETNFYKLMNNSVFGKTVENVEKRVDVRLVSAWENQVRRQGARALISRPNFNSSHAISEDLVVIQMTREKIIYNKPIYVGFSVLDLSKTLMYDFHYKYIVPKFGPKVDLLYTDTDSFIYDVRTADFFADIRDDVSKRFDTSDYPEKNRFNLKVANRMVLGMFKDECKGVMIKEFIGIRSKCYFILKEDGKTIKKIKGVKKSVVSQEVRREDFYNCLNELQTVYKEWNSIMSKKHSVYTQTQKKVALRNDDDKRFTIPDNPHRTLAWGHRDIKNVRSDLLVQECEE